MEQQQMIAVQQQQALSRTLFQFQLERQPQLDLQALKWALADLGMYCIPLQNLEIDERDMIGSGGFGVVTQGRLSGYPSAVAVKRLRSDDAKDIRVAKRLVREMKAWSKLQHPNILPLLGFHLSDNLDLALIICPLQPYGNVKGYLQQMKPSNLDRLGLALDTICAVEYLHSLDPPVVHGDLKALNVLMSNERRAILCDFGLAVAADEVQSGLTTSRGFKGSIRYCSPELVMEEEARRSPASDMWAWGCLVVEIMKETVPYARQNNDGQVMCALLRGDLPGSEELLKDPINIWPVVRGCWQVDPQIRSIARTSAIDLRLLIAAPGTFAQCTPAASYLTANARTSESLKRQVAFENGDSTQLTENRMSYKRPKMDNMPELQQLFEMNQPPAVTSGPCRTTRHRFTQLEIANAALHTRSIMDAFSQNAPATFNVLPSHHSVIQQRMDMMHGLAMQATANLPLFYLLLPQEEQQLKRAIGILSLIKQQRMILAQNPEQKHFIFSLEHLNIWQHLLTAFLVRIKNILASADGLGPMLPTQSQAPMQQFQALQQKQSQFLGSQPQTTHQPGQRDGFDFSWKVGETPQLVQPPSNQGPTLDSHIGHAALKMASVAEASDSRKTIGSSDARYYADNSVQKWGLHEILLADMGVLKRE
ncbi:hypothetical protein FRB94_013835 [Tulasnella sp. JGI-2019a]|nr:hypothetical protein FRB94_013835 [Tulasnella sp. JGI-2019a]